MKKFETIIHNQEILKILHLCHNLFFTGYFVKLTKILSISVNVNFFQIMINRDKSKACHLLKDLTIRRNEIHENTEF